MSHLITHKELSFVLDPSLEVIITVVTFTAVEYISG